MDKSTDDKYSPRFMAQVALEATSKTKIRELAQKYAIPEWKINEWAHRLRERAEFLFTDEHNQDETRNIKEQAALLRSALEATPNGILVTDLGQNVITYNQKCLEMWKVPEHIVARGKIDEAMQHILKMIKHPGEFQQKIRKRYENPGARVKDTVELKDGRFFERYSVPHRVGNKIIGHITNFIDVTEYKKNEDKLSRFGNLLQSINANVNEAILRSTPDEGLIYVNDAFVELFGYDSKEEVLEIDPSQFYANQRDRWELVQQLKEEGQFQNEEVLFRRKDGSTFWGLENSTLDDGNGEIYIDGVVTNIDNWKQAEQALRQSEEKYRTILKNIEEGYFETNLAGDFTFFNVALVDIMRYSADEMVSMNYHKYTNAESAEKVYRTFNRVYKTGRSEQAFDWELICGDGSKIYVEVSVTLRTDSEGEPVGFSGMVRDITERKRKQRQLQDSLKEKEVLLGEIHHRVKNNLAVISGLLYLQANKTDDVIATDALMQSRTRINSMALIHELLYDNLSFARLKPQTYIEQLVQHISANLSPPQADITTEIEAENFDLEMSTAIPCALIINELITNAYKYAFEEQDEGTVAIKFKKRDNRTYHLEVADDGRGLPEDFDISDSSQHQLGLSLVKTLTRQLSGNLHTHNGDGARFIVTFER